MTGWVIQLLVAAGVVQGQPEVIVLPPAPGVVEVVPSPLLKPSVDQNPSTTLRPSSGQALRISAAERPQIEAWIDQYAQEYGVSAGTLRYMAKCESGFNSRAVNGPYAGIYQYSASSWASNRKLMGENPDFSLRFDAREAIKTTAHIISTRGGSMWPNCMPNP